MATQYQQGYLQQQGYPQQGYPPQQGYVQQQEPPKKSKTGLYIGIGIAVIVVVIVLIYISSQDSSTTPVQGTLGGVTTPDNKATNPITNPIVANVATTVVNPAQPTTQPTTQPTIQPNISVYTPPVITIEPAVPATTVSAPLTAMATSTGPPLVSKIILIKDTSALYPEGTSNEGRIFQVGELKVYDVTGKLLTATDYTSVKYCDLCNTDWSRSFPATKAVDGNSNSFAHTGSLYSKQSMIFILKNPTNVSKIQVINRSDCCQNRLDGVVMELYAADDTVIKRFTLTKDMTQDYIVAQVS